MFAHVYLRIYAPQLIILRPHSTSGSAEELLIYWCRIFLTLYLAMASLDDTKSTGNKEK